MFGFPYPPLPPGPMPKASTLPCPPPVQIECPYGPEAHMLQTDDYGGCRTCRASRSDRDRLWRQLGRESPEK